MDEMPFLAQLLLGVLRPLVRVISLKLLFVKPPGIELWLGAHKCLSAILGRSRSSERRNAQVTRPRNDRTRVEPRFYWTPSSSSLL